MSEAVDQSPQMGQRAKRGAIYLGIAQIARLCLTMLSTIIISRLLSPDDYGVIAMAAPVTMFVAMFQDLGLSAAAIQKKHLTSAESNVLFWINVTASLVVTLTLVTLSPAVSWFYNDPRAGYVTAASAIGLLITGTSLQHSALLDREMRFGTLSMVDVATAAVTFFVSAGAALILHSYWSIVIGTIAGAVVQATSLWMASPWRPESRISLTGTRSALAFGSHVTGFNLVNFFVRNADNVIIAKASGSEPLGLYDRSYKLMMMPIQNLNAPVNRLLFPLLSRLQDDPEKYRSSFVFGIRMVMLASAPGIAVATAFSDRLMPFLLGDRWSGAAPIFFWLGLTGLIQPIANMTGNLFLSTGRSALQLKWGLFSAIVTLVGFASGLPWGARGIAASLFFTMLVRVPILFTLSTRDTPVHARDLYGAQIEPLIGAGIAIGIMMLAAPHLSTLPLLCLALPLAYLFATATSVLSASGRDAVRRAARLGWGVLEAVRATLIRGWSRASL